MELLAIRLGCQKTTAKSLVIRANGFVIYLLADSIMRAGHSKIAETARIHRQGHSHAGGIMDNPEQEIVEHKVRRATGINALRKIGVIVAEEQQADADNARALRWFVRYGLLILIGGALLLAYFMGVI
jgi:hypothetical protein